MNDNTDGQGPARRSDARTANAPAGRRGTHPAIREVRELPDGYAFLVASNPVPLLMVLELFKPDHISYRLLRIAVADAAGTGAVWVQVTGSDEVKDYLWSALFQELPAKGGASA